MKLNAQAILQGVLGERHWDKPQCAECHGGLSALIDAELDAEEMHRHFSSVQKHLASCEACQEEYQELKALLKAERRGELVKPPYQPTFDFSYLKKYHLKPSAQQSNRINVRPMQHLFSLFYLQAGRLLALFFHRPIAVTLNTPSRQASYDTTLGRSYRLSLPIQISELQIGLVLGPPSPQNTATAFGVQVHWAETGQPAGQIQVAVCDTHRRVVDQKWTSEEGRASFSRVLAGDYLLEVRHRDAVLQLPLALQMETERV